MFKFDPNASYLMPAHFGPMHVGGRPTGWYHDVTTMVVSYLTDREKLAAYLPEPYEAAEEPIVTVIYARNRKVDWLAGRGYNLIGVNAAVDFNGEKDKLSGQFTLVMWENLTDPILTGREMQGIPKIYADIPDHSIIEGEWRANASHFGHKILDMSIKDLRKPTPEEVAAGQKAQETDNHPMGWRYLPGVGGFGSQVSEATTFPSENFFTEGWIGAGEIEWNRLTWEQNPTQFHIVNALADLPIIEYRPAVITKGSTNLFILERLPRALV